MSLNFDFALCDRRIGQTLVSPPAEPGVTTSPLPHATGAHGQFPGRDFNPLDLLLLLRTASIVFDVGLREAGLGADDLRIIWG